MLGMKSVTGVERDLEDEELVSDNAGEEDAVGLKQVDPQDDDDIGELAADAESRKTRPQSRGGRDPEPAGTENSLTDAKEVEDLVDRAVEDEEAHKSPSRRKGRPATSRRGTTTTTRSSPSKTSPAKQRGTVRRHETIDVESEDEDPPDEPPARTIKTSMKQRSKSAHKPADLGSDSEGPDSVLKKPSLDGAQTRIKPKSHHKGKAKAVDRRPVDVSSDEDQPPPAKTRRPAKKGATSKSADPFADAGTDSDSDLPFDVRPAYMKSSPSRGKGELGDKPSTTNRTPKRVVSVVVPHFSPAKSTSAKERGGEDVARTGGVRVATAHEAGVASSSKPQLKRARADENRTPEVIVGKLTRTPSKRSAANKATQKLREEVMPDVMNYQLEMKRSKGKGKQRAEERNRDSISVISGREEEGSDDNESNRVIKKRKVSKGGASTTASESDRENLVRVAGDKRRVAAVREEEESSGSEIVVGTSKKGAAAMTKRPGGNIASRCVGNLLSSPTS
jgi:hypothetical protein